MLIYPKYWRTVMHVITSGRQYPKQTCMAGEGTSKFAMSSKGCYEGEALLRPSIKTLACATARSCSSLGFQESLEAAERECKESAGAKEALRSQLSKAAAAEDSSRAQCEQLEAQAASTAEQVQELRQQVSARLCALRLHRAQLLKDGCSLVVNSASLSLEHS